MYNAARQFTVFAAGALVSLLSAYAVPARAEFVTLADLNSEVTIDPNSLAGVFNWSVDGTNHIAEQTFWLGTGTTGGESDLSLFSPSYSLTSGTSGLRISYAQPQFEIVAQYLLTGGPMGSRTSQLSESVRITNTTSADTLSFRLFQETDFDLNNAAGGDIVYFVAPNTWYQFRPDGATAVTVADPAPDRWEAAFYPSTLVHLLDGTPSMLNDNSGPVGPGDVTWASQWNPTLGPGASFEIDVVKSITDIPEPGTMLLAGAALAGLLLGRFRRRNAGRPPSLRTWRISCARRHEHL